MPEQKGFEDAAADRVNQLIDPMVEASAGMMGMPSGGKKYTTDEQLMEWNASPIADPQQRLMTMQQLMMQGKTDEEITDMVYPGRRRLQTMNRTKIDEQVKFAREMRTLMDKKAAELTAPQSAQMDAPAMLPESVSQLPPAPSVATPQPSPAPQPAPSMLDMPLSMMGG